MESGSTDIETMSQKRKKFNDYIDAQSIGGYSESQASHS